MVFCVGNNQMGEVYLTLKKYHNELNLEMKKDIQNLRHHEYMKMWHE